METKFTKGGWVVINTSTCSKYASTISTTAIQDNPNKPTYICDMWGMATDEGKANAKLIIAAPEMLNALSEAEIFIKEIMPLVRAQMDLRLESPDIKIQSVYNRVACEIQNQKNEDFKILSNISAIIKKATE